MGQIVKQHRIVLALGIGAMLATVGRAAVTIQPLQGDSPAEGPVPTIAQAQADLDNGRYTWCAQKIARILAGPPEPSPSDKWALLSLKGECLLQEREGLGAVEAFNAAAKSSTDKNEIATASVTATLIQRSTGFTYIPVIGKDHHPLPIMDKKKRAAALAALWADELAREKPAVDAALKKTDLHAAISVAPLVRSLENFELAATSGSSAVDAMIKSLADHTQELLAGTVSEENATADAMTTAALQMADVPATDNVPAHKQRKGLSADDKAKAKDMLAATEKMPADVAALTKALGVEDSLYAGDLAANELLAKRLKNMSLGILRSVRSATRPAPGH